MGHRYVKAFKAQGNFQKMLIKFQSSKDIDSWDTGKITYVGYVYSMVCVATALIVVPFSLITVFINRDIAAWTYLFWFGGCFVLGICIFLIQVIDSILNFILEIFNK